MQRKKKGIEWQQSRKRRCSKVLAQRLHPRVLEVMFLETPRELLRTMVGAMLDETSYHDIATQASLLRVSAVVAVLEGNEQEAISLCNEYARIARRSIGQATQDVADDVRIIRNLEESHEGYIV